MSPEDTIDPRSSTGQSARTLAATVAAIDREGLDVTIDLSSRGSGVGVGEHRRSAPAERQPEPHSTDQAGRTDAPLLRELARLTVAHRDALKAFVDHGKPTEPRHDATAAQWERFAEAKRTDARLCEVSGACRYALNAFVDANIEALREAAW